MLSGPPLIFNKGNNQVVNEVTTIFSPAERVPVERAFLDEVALPAGDNYGDELFTEYLADYAGMAVKYHPARVFEIGVRFGYIAMCMANAVHNAGAQQFEYLGIDDESYVFGSCERANANFAHRCPYASMRAIKANSFYGLPQGIGTFDFIHVDGNHDYHGVQNDLGRVWPLLNEGGFILLDDAAKQDDQGNPGPIYRAIQDFLNTIPADDRVEWQYVENQRCHVYIHRLPAAQPVAEPVAESTPAEAPA